MCLQILTLNLKVMYDIGDKINLAVFPGLQVITQLKFVAILSQGGPHNHAIAGIAVAMKQANSEEFKTYQKQVEHPQYVVYKTFTPMLHQGCEKCSAPG